MQALIADGERAKAHTALLDIDHHFGGLAAPRSLELEAALGGPLPAGR